jgi:hypothetical protein
MTDHHAVDHGVEHAADHTVDLAEELQEFVYGTITVLVAIGAINGQKLTSGRNAIVIILGTALATWLAHTFAAVIGIHVRERRPVTRQETLTEFSHSWRVVTAAFPATAACVLAQVGVFSLRFALVASIVMGVIALIVVAIFAATRSSFTTWGVVAYAAGATSIGLLIVAIEIAIHH